MTVRIDLPPTGLPSSGLAANGNPPRQAGQLQGVPAQVDSGPSVLGAAAEEISLHVSEKVESKTHLERTVRATRPPRAMTVEQINAYLEQAKKRSDSEEMRALAKRMLQASGQELSHLARHSRFSRPTDRFLLLQFALELGRQEGASREAMEALEDALPDLESWHGDTIHTDLATIGSASRFGDDAGEIAHLQGSVNSVLGKPSLSQALQEVLGLAGKTGEKLERAIAGLMEALGACLAGTSSAAEKALLETLVSDLYHLKTLRSLLEDCKQLLAQLRRHTDEERERQRRKPQAPQDEPEDDLLGAPGRAVRAPGPAR